MASCELCGRNPSVYQCEIEGTMMKVCSDCSRFGKVKGKTDVRVVIVDNKKPLPKEPEYAFVSGYGSIVKNAREKKGLKQEDFAKSINEHRSVIHQVESEHMKPNIPLAKKLEKALGIKIVDELKSESIEDEDNKDIKLKTSFGPNARPSQKQPSGMTLGDLMGKR